MKKIRLNILIFTFISYSLLYFAATILSLKYTYSFSEIAKENLPIKDLNSTILTDGYFQSHYFDYDLNVKNCDSSNFYECDVSDGIFYKYQTQENKYNISVYNNNGKGFYLKWKINKGENKTFTDTTTLVTNLDYESLILYYPNYRGHIIYKKVDTIYVNIKKGYYFDIMEAELK